MSVVPKTSDSRLNTAKLVFQKEDENRENAYRYATLILTIVFSFCGGYCLKFYADTLFMEIDSLDHDKKMTDSIKKTALIVLVFYALSISSAVIYCFKHESLSQSNIGNAACFFISFAILLVFVVCSLVTFCFRCSEDISRKEYYLYPFSFAVSFHFSWVSLGIFSNPLWAFPVLLTILTSIFLVYNAVHYNSRLKSNKGSLVKLFLVMSISFFSYMSFTWISARSFFTNQLISSFIQMFLTACAGLFAHIFVDKERKKVSKTQANKGTSDGEPTSTALL